MLKLANQRYVPKPADKAVHIYLGNKVCTGGKFASGTVTEWMEMEASGIAGGRA